MTVKQSVLVEESWKKLKPSAYQTINAFYQNVANIDDSLFSGLENIKNNSSTLITQLDEAIEVLSEPEQLEALIKKLQAQNIAMQLNEQHYETVQDAFLQYLEEALMTKFTVTSRKAWTSVSKKILNHVLINALNDESIVNDNAQIKGDTNDMNQDSKTSNIQVNESEYKELLAKMDAISKSQAVIEFNMDGTIITANDNFLNAVGYSLDEIQGQHHSLFVEPSYKTSYEYKAFWDNLNNGQYESNEYKRLGKGGKEIWIQASYNPILGDDGKPTKVVKYATDVTEQKLQNANFSGQISAIGKSQAVIEFNMDGTIITANDNFLNAVGYTLQEVQGQHHSMFVEHEYKASHEYSAFWDSLNRGQYDSNEYKRIGKGGKEVWIQASYNPILDLNGKPFKVVKYATDITGRKNAIAQIKEALITISKGDLSQGIDTELVGEFNIIGGSINEVIDVLNSMVDEIRKASTNVFDSAREIAAGNNELSHRTESQASSLEETASAMEELTSTVQQNAENATEASKLSTSVMLKASNGGEVVKNAITAMSDINKSSKKIADIISVIDEIAFQTNLLALNAAVEAARAGEQGRGFAVVAAEVRNLAQRSAGAAKEIKGLINDSVEAVGQGTKLVDETGQTFSELVSSIEEVSQMISDIDSAGKEQSAGIGEVSAAVSQMDEMTQQNAALVEEAAASSKSMEEQSQSLLDQVAFFNTGEAQHSHSNMNQVVNLQSVRGAPPQRRTRPAAPASARFNTSRAPTPSDQEWEEF
ncbi:methyl-accepting chemotaxis protein [Pseudocolwellia sp. HL-MZ7]|uniref:methyl-accepting chemotaxis protein n=2 Tax=unclassified Pseudocolwellia TaxID=2848178 RepID=UPI003CF016E9